MKPVYHVIVNALIVLRTKINGEKNLCDRLLTRSVRSDKAIVVIVGVALIDCEYKAFSVSVQGLFRTSGFGAIFCQHDDR